MTDTLSTQMGRKNGRRNKSTASVGSKKSRAQSVSTGRFQPSVDGFSAFLIVVSRLGRNGQDFTWHDIRKVYHRETQRQLTVEELNAIFSAKNMTKREIFELPKVKSFIASMDGSMMCRFHLICEPNEDVLREFDLPPLMTNSVESDINTHSSASPDPSVSPCDEKAIAISTDCEAKAAGPTSDLSKSETSPSQRSLSQQASVQSSVTDDEGWASGKENRSENSSPISTEEKDEVDFGTKVDLEDDVFETEHRIAAGSDQIDGAVGVEEAKFGHVFGRHDELASPILVTESIEAAFEAIQPFVHTSTILPEAQNASEAAIVPATPRKVAPVPVERSEKPIKKLIEKFDNAVNFTEHKSTIESSPSKSIYTQVLEEIGETQKQIDQVFTSSRKEQHEEAEVTNVIFRSTSTHSSIIAQGKEQLAEFVAEQKKTNGEIPEQVANTTTDETESAFAVKEQSSLSSLDREYFDSKMLKSEDLFAELGVHDADGFQLKSNGSKNLSAIKSPSDDSNVQSSDIITVIEKCPMSPIAADEVRNRSNSIESDADVPYSLCSEDEAEPMTMIDKSMKVSQSAEQLSSPKEEQKPKTVVVNVELDAKAKREEPAVDVNTTVKERIAALQSAVAKKQIPSAKLNEKDGVLVLNRTEELEQSILKVKPATNATNSDGSMRRRQVRFMRGCCVVQ
uniref:Uncharacterized protein n=1 Tax=Caenorhabditis japonica TaxID=281687 RepID=A0A8R1HWP1_CAEJA